MTVLISSHLLSEIDQIATSVGIISDGKIIFQDSIDALREHAQENIILRVHDGIKASQALEVGASKQRAKTDFFICMNTRTNTWHRLFVRLSRKGLRYIA